MGVGKRKMGEKTTKKLKHNYGLPSWPIAHSSVRYVSAQSEIRCNCLTHKETTIVCTGDPNLTRVLRPGKYFDKLYPF